jgi:hypothetical protein
MRATSRLFALDGEPMKKPGQQLQAATAWRTRISDVWLTPPELLAALGSFDLDPCACPEPRPWATAAKMLTLPTNGLAAPWEGRVWLNPPYGPETPRWLARMAAHRFGTALIAGRTETRWFQDQVFHAASYVLFLRGRLQFHRQDGTRAKRNAGIGHVLAAYGEDDAEKLNRSGIPGTFMRPSP